MKSLLCTCGAFAALAFAIATPSRSEHRIILANAPVSQEFKFGVKKKPTQSHSQTAQAIGYVCRNGGFWCRDGFSFGILGTPCCGCNFCGWWSTF